MSENIECSIDNKDALIAMNKKAQRVVVVVGDSVTPPPPTATSNQVVVQRSKLLCKPQRTPVKSSAIETALRFASPNTAQHLNGEDVFLLLCVV